MDFASITTPTTTDLLISFMDIQGFLRIAQAQRDLIKLFGLLDRWAAIIVEEIEEANGRVVKFIGDACLIVFDAGEAEQGILAIRSAKQKAEKFLADQGFSNKISATAHVGKAVVGLFGAGHCRSFDVFGDSVAAAAALERGEKRGRLVLSPQAFRTLTPPSRKLFHKYTPPVVYIAEEI